MLSPSAPEGALARSLTAFFASQEEQQSALGRQVLGPQPVHIELLSFVVGRESFALPVTDVAEVVRLGVLTRIPQVSSSTLGLMSLRGHMVPVVVLAALLGVRARDKTSGPPRRGIVIQDAAPVGLAVDEIEGVCRFPAEAVIAPPPQSGGLLSGLCMAPAGPKRLIDTAQLLRHLERVP